MSIKFKMRWTDAKGNDRSATFMPSVQEGLTDPEYWRQYKLVHDRRLRDVDPEKVVVEGPLPATTEDEQIASRMLGQLAAGVKVDAKAAKKLADDLRPKPLVSKGALKEPDVPNTMVTAEAQRERQQDAHKSATAGKSK